MTTNKPEVVAIMDMDNGGLTPQKTAMGISHGTQLIRLRDYEALQAECERLWACLRMEVDAGDSWKRQCQDAEDERDQLRDECEKLRKDAERYRLVRSRIQASNARGPSSWVFHYTQLPRPIGNPMAGPPAWEHFDAAIDDAIQKGA
ncbi:hypothetical protein [Halopseudomonas bauzanensis]|uniref:hypothetical protein n=1 Tax=Halopseudomonas bauzanensis TaxID=653930 RepID=UPI0025556DB2|nr:hypothetical protein [Halopseudomonas bauzanensis]